MKQDRGRRYTRKPDPDSTAQVLADIADDRNRWTSMQICQHCNQAFRIANSGRGGTYCSDRCRVYAHRAKKKALAGCQSRQPGTGEKCDLANGHPGYCFHHDSVSIWPNLQP